jgi:uncharacterized protein YgbK (DUF1537 family)
VPGPFPELSLGRVRLYVKRGTKVKLRVAIIADDLTGALDTATPFAMNGLSVAVAVTIDGLAVALASGVEVVAVNTASRALAPSAACARMTAVAHQLAAASPAIVIKKIDSRLKGNIAVETDALVQATGRHNIVVALAVPDQHRFVRNGHVEGRGVEEPLPVEPIFKGRSLKLTIMDAGDQGALDRLVLMGDWSDTTAVGARGLGLAFARHLRRKGLTRSFVPSARTLFAFGSRDPITTGQMDILIANGPSISVLDAPDGRLPSGGPVTLPSLLRCVGDLSADPSAVAELFADGIAERVRSLRPEMLMLGGGDTAAAALRRLGVDVLTPIGEIEPGVPWFEIEVEEGYRLACGVKSGGFGTADTLLRMMPALGGRDRL